jgi:hypothetical protein
MPGESGGVGQQRGEPTAEKAREETEQRTSPVNLA